MVFRIMHINADDASTIIKSTQAVWIEAKESVELNLGYQIASRTEVNRKLEALQLKSLQDLQEGKATHIIKLEQEKIKAYQHEISEYELEVADIQQKVSKVESRNKRILEIKDQQNTSFFLIAASTTQQEIKELMTNITQELLITMDPVQKQFLETLQETAVSCKEYISQGQIFPDQYIPLLESEKKFAIALGTVATINKKLDVLINEHPALANDFKIIQDMYNQAVDRKSYLGFIGKESAFLKKIQTDIEAVINTQSILDGPLLLQKIQPQIAEHINRLDTTASYSYAFKKMINQLCAKFNELSTKIKVPMVFNVTDIKENMAAKFKQIKNEFKEIKANSVNMNAMPDRKKVEPSVSDGIEKGKDIKRSP